MAAAGTAPSAFPGSEAHTYTHRAPRTCATAPPSNNQTVSANAASCSLKASKISARIRSCVAASAVAAGRDR